MKNLLRLSVCLTALSLYVSQASNFEDERATQAQPSSRLSQLFDQHLNKSLSLSDITTIRRTLGEHILNITNAQTIPQEDWARLYLDSLTDPTQAYYISQEMARKILDLDTNGYFKLHMPVKASTYRTAHLGDIYFKQSEENYIFPGREYAMYSFYGMLVGQILAPSCLMVLQNVNSPQANNFFVQASQFIPGMTLETALQRDEVPLLNPDNLSRFLTASWLASPSNYKPDKMIVSARGDQNYLVGIDNDLIFNAPIARENADSFQHILGIKQVLYCIPEYMSEACFSEHLRRELCALNPHLKMLEWLQALIIQNEQYERLKQASILTDKDYQLFGLPIKFIPGIAERLKEQLYHLQAILHDHSGFRHDEVWRRLQPVPHFIYNSIRKVIDISSTPEQIRPLNFLNLISERSGQTLESYLPLNSYLEDYGQIQEGQRIYVNRRLYQHLRQYQTLAYEHTTQLTEEIQKAIAVSIDHLSIAKLSKDEQLEIYKFIADHCPETLLNSRNTEWRQQDILQELYCHAGLTEAQVTLLLQLGLVLSQVPDNNQEPELHQLVKKGLPYHHHIKALVQQRNVNINAVNSKGLTPLDEALALNDAATVRLLLELGGGEKVDLEALMTFYQQYADNAEWQPLFRELRKRNQKFAWQSSVWHLFPPATNEEQLEERFIQLVSSKPTKRYLPDNTWQQIIAQGRKIRKVNQEGRRTVAKAIWEREGERQSVYLKFFPELPGFETAISLLMLDYLFGFGAPYGELALLHAQGNSLPCYISQGIEGESLHKMLTNHPERLKQLDPYSYSALIIGTMLFGPEDGTPTNYIVEPLSNSFYRVIGIDLDHALADPLVQEKVVGNVKCYPQVKTILYCMDQMRDRIDPEVKAKIIATNFKALLENWLNKLKSIQQDYSTLFNDPEQLHALYQNPTRPCFIGIPFKTEMIAKLYDRCIRLQTFLTQQGNGRPTHSSILRRVEPQLAERYNLKPLQRLSLLDRFERIDGKYFQKSENSHFMSTTTLDGLLAGLHLKVHDLPSKKRLIEAVREGENIGPAQALRELQLEHQVLVEQDNSLEQFKKLETEEARAKFLEHLPRVAVSLQSSWLQEIQRRRCRHLTLSSFNQLNSQHISKLYDLKNLSYLNVRGCYGLDSYLTFSLKDCSNLTYLDASETALTEFSAMARFRINSAVNFIRNKIITFPRLQVLKLENCQQLSRINLIAPKLLQLSLANSRNLRFIEGELPKLVQLDLSNVRQLPQSVLDQLFNQLTQFKVMNLTGCTQLRYADLITEAPGYSLQVYEFVTQLSRDHRSQWQRLLKNDSTLQQLDLTDTQIGITGAQALAKALKVNSTLQQLNLGGNQIGDAGVQAFAERLKENSTLQKLDLQYNQISDAGGQALAEALKVNSILQKLDLQYNQIGDAGGQALAEALKVNSSLQQLDLWDNQIGDAGGQALAEALKVNSNLQQLDLQHNQIGDAGGQALAEALKGNSSLQRLDLKYNQIGDAGVQALAEALKVNSNLQQLDLKYDQIGAVGVQALAEGLKVNSSLQQLNLWGNQIGDAGVQALAEALKVNSSLQRLDLKYDQIGAVGVQALAEALKVNSNLQQLDLQGNQIGNAGGQALAEGLKVNSNLQQLDLQRNQISAEGAKALAEALKVNSTLQQLDLQRNQISTEGAKALAEALKVNSSLQQLDLQYNQIGDAGGQTLAEALKVNSSLQQLDLNYNLIRNALEKQINNLLEGRNKPLPASASIVSALPQVITPALEENTEELLLSQWLQHSAFEETVAENLTFIPTNSEPWRYSILSIDGGGIRGYIPALILEKLQDYAGHHPIHSLFDYIGGTSVGGILSLGLTVPEMDDDSRPRYSISNLTQLFSQEGHRIFPPLQKLCRPFKRLITTKYSAEPLEGLLKEYFGNSLLSSAITPTLVTAALNHGSGWEGFAFTSVAAQKDELDDYHMWKVARCTSAAPTYFDAYKIRNIHDKLHPLPANPDQSNPYRLYSNNQTLLHDGGLWYNNPTKVTYRALQAYTAQNALPATNSNCLVVSLGTGKSPLPSLKHINGEITAAIALIQGDFYQREREIHAYCQRKFGSNYYRLQPDLGREIDLDDVSSTNLDALRDAAATLFPGDRLESLARRLLQNKDERHRAQLH